MKLSKFTILVAKANGQQIQTWVIGPDKTSAINMVRNNGQLSVGDLVKEIHETEIEGQS